MSLDVRELPSYAMSHRAITWWGMMGLMAIEGTVFALAVMSYFYLRSHSRTWPMSAPPPDLLWGTLNTVLLVLSMIPNHLAKKAADKRDRDGVKLWLSVVLVAGIGFLVIRCFEFAALNCRWDSSAYGSVVWLLLALHTTHLATDVYDSAVLDVMFFVEEPLCGKRHADASENAIYWYFVVWSWLPIYAVIYWGARAV